MKSILHIEDESSFRENMAFLLNEEGFKTISVDSGEKAINVLEKTKPDLVLCDVKMPGMSGVELFKYLRGCLDHSFYASIPFIFLSGIDDSSEMAKTIQLEADDYLIKGTSFAILVAKINNLIKKYERLNTALPSYSPTFENVFEIKSSIASIQHYAVAAEKCKDDQEFYLNKIKDTCQRVISGSKKNKAYYGEYNTPIDTLTLQKSTFSPSHILDTTILQLKHYKMLLMSRIFLDIPSGAPTIKVDLHYFSKALELTILELISSSDMQPLSIKVDSVFADEVEIIFSPSLPIDKLKSAHRVLSASPFIQNVLLLHRMELSISKGTLKLLIPSS